MTPTYLNIYFMDYMILYHGKDKAILLFSKLSAVNLIFIDSIFSINIDFEYDKVF